MTAKLRIYADFNSTWENAEGEWCWCLRYQGRLLDDCADELRLHDGMEVVVYYEEPGEEFEFDAVLGRPENPITIGKGWMARLLPNTFRRLRG